MYFQYFAVVVAQECSACQLFKRSRIHILPGAGLVSCPSSFISSFNQWCVQNYFLHTEVYFSYPKHSKVSCLGLNSLINHIIGEKCIFNTNKKKKFCYFSP